MTPVARLLCGWVAAAVSLHAAAASADATHGGQAGYVADKIVAVVDTQTVTQSELAAEARLAVVRRSADKVRAASVALDGAFLHDFLDYLIGQMLVAREARRVGIDDVPASEVEQAFRALVAGFPTEADYEVFVANLGATPSFIREVLRRDRQNERYLQQRLRTRLAGLGVAPDAEGDGRGAARRAEALRTFLPAYLAELRQSVEVRRLGPSGALEREQAP